MDRQYKKIKLIFGFDKLPIEALYNIALNLDNATDLKALALTSKFFGLYIMDKEGLTIVENTA